MKATKKPAKAPKKAMHAQMKTPKKRKTPKKAMKAHIMKAKAAKDIATRMSERFKWLRIND